MDIAFVIVSILSGKQKPLYTFNAKMDLMLVIYYEVIKSANTKKKRCVLVSYCKHTLSRSSLSLARRF